MAHPEGCRKWEPSRDKIPYLKCQNADNLFNRISGRDIIENSISRGGAYPRPEQSSLTQQQKNDRDIEIEDKKARKRTGTGRGSESITKKKVPQTTIQEIGWYSNKKQTSIYKICQPLALISKLVPSP